MRETFKQVIQDISKYCSTVHGMTQEQQAEAFGVSVRTLSYWISKDYSANPNAETLTGVYSFLETVNGGARFIERLNNRTVSGYKSVKDDGLSVLPPGLSDKDIRIIQESFLSPDELDMLFSMIINNDRNSSICEIIPGDAYKQLRMKRAIFASQWDHAMQQAKEVFGLVKISDWEECIVRHMNPSDHISYKGEITQLEQKVLNNLVGLYLVNYRRQKTFLADTLSDINEILRSFQNKKTPREYNWQDPMDRSLPINRYLSALLNNDYTLTETGSDYIDWYKNYA